MKKLAYLLIPLLLNSCINSPEINTNKVLSTPELVNLINVIIKRNKVDIDKYEKLCSEKYPKPKCSSDGIYRIDPFKHMQRPSIKLFIDSISIKDGDIFFFSYMTMFNKKETVGISASMIDLNKTFLTTDNKVMHLAALRISCKLTEYGKYSYCFKTKDEDINHWQGQEANPKEFSFMHDSIESKTIRKLFNQIVFSMNNETLK